MTDTAISLDSLGAIAEASARAFEVEPAELRGGSRTRAASAARAACLFLMRKWRPRLPLTRLAREVGLSDHTAAGAALARAAREMGEPESPVADAIIRLAYDFQIDLTETQVDPQERFRRSFNAEEQRAIDAHIAAGGVRRVEPGVSMDEALYLHPVRLGISPPPLTPPPAATRRPESWLVRMCCRFRAARKSTSTMADG